MFLLVLYGLTDWQTESSQRGHFFSGCDTVLTGTYENWYLFPLLIGEYNNLNDLIASSQFSVINASAKRNRSTI
jgi:hypothetical protein